MVNIYDYSFPNLFTKMWDDQEKVRHKKEWNKTLGVSSLKVEKKPPVRYDF